MEASQFRMQDCPPEGLVSAALPEATIALKTTSEWTERQFWPRGGDTTQDTTRCPVHFLSRIPTAQIVYRGLKLRKSLNLPNSFPGLLRSQGLGGAFVTKNALLRFPSTEEHGEASCHCGSRG